MPDYSFCIGALFGAISVLSALIAARHLRRYVADVVRDAHYFDQLAQEAKQAKHEGEPDNA